MTAEEFDQLAIAYLQGSLQGEDFTRLQQQLELDPGTTARILELADEELLLKEGLKAPRVVARVSERLARISGRSLRISQRSRRLSQRRLRESTSFSPVLIAVGLAAALAICLFALKPWEIATDQPALAKLSGASPDSTIVRGGQTLHAKAGVSLSAQDRVSTHEGVASILYADGTVVQLSANSTLQLDASTSGKLVELLSGTLHCVAAKQPAAAPLTLRTREADSTVVGTTFKLASSLGSTTLQVDEGAIKFSDRATHEAVQVNAGEIAVADNKNKLAVTKLNAPSVVAIPDTFSAEFPNQSSFAQGVLDREDVPPGGVASVGEVPIPNSDKLSIMQSKFTEAQPYFVLRDDTVIHLQYRSEITGGFSEFEVFLSNFPADGWDPCINLICRVKPRSTNWESVDLPLSRFLPASESMTKKVEGMVCRAFFVQTYSYSGIKVGKFWVTRGTKE